MIFLLKGLVIFNTIILRLGRQLAWISIGLMVIIILIQVFFRYGLNSALPWPDEAARFLMLWMTGFIAPSAYRWGGFVSIEMIFRLLPSRIIKLLTLFLLILSIIISTIYLVWYNKSIKIDLDSRYITQTNDVSGISYTIFLLFEDNYLPH